MFSVNCFPQHAAEKKAKEKTEYSNKKQLRRLSEESAIYVEGMQYIPGGTFTSGTDAQYLTAEPQDSTLLVGTHEKRDTVSDFYISDHEVTNAEYRQFINWVKDSIAMTMLAAQDDSWYADSNKKILNWKKRKDIWKLDTIQAKILDPLYYIKPDKFIRKKEIDNRKLLYAYKANGFLIPLAVYPDEERFVKESVHGYNGYYTSHYFKDQIYNDYPVLAVTWHQASAYCQWRSDQFNKANAENNKKSIPIAEFRLPSEKEWEYAALSLAGYSNYGNINAKGLFPWAGWSLIDENGKYRANFGAIHAQNDYTIKHFLDDGGYYPLKVKFYKANAFNLYDMAGNVAEWTNTRPEIKQLVNEAWHLFFTNYFRENLSNDQPPKILMRNNIFHFSALDSIRNLTALSHIDSAETINQKIRQRFSLYHQLVFHRIPDDTVVQKMIDFAISYYDDLTKIELQNSRILDKNPEPRIVKGGSWASGPAYLLCGSKEAFSEDKCSSRIGFRVLMEIIVNP